MENYSVIDMDGCASALREGVAKSFTENYTENLDDLISIQQVINMIQEHSLGQDEEGFHLINEEVFDFVFNEIRIWIYEVGLAKLAAQGHVECAWDNESNDMVFWLADKNKITTNNKPTN